MSLRVRDLDAEWTEKWVASRPVRRTLAVAITALREMEGPCGNCGGEIGWELGDGSWWDCPDCDGTGHNPARRALDTVIGEGS